MIRHVTLLAMGQMLSSSVAIPLEMLEATRARLRLARDPRAVFQVDVVAQQLQPLTMLGGFQIRPGKILDEVEHTDLIVVPALWRNPKPQLAQQADTIAWLARQYRAGASIIAIGTGVCLLAEAGLLDGKPATTHWHYLDQFARDYPKVKLQRQHLLTQDGRLYCAASVNSGADLMVHFIGLQYGRELALQVEQQFSPEVRNPFEKKVFYADQAHQHPDEVIALAQTWLQQNVQKPLLLSQLAADAGLSERQFDRRFRAVTSTTPTQYLQKLRCDNARDLLQNSNLSVADIAAAVGYNDGGYFTRIFRRLAGQTPAEYRKKVRAKLFSS
ncbi:GlxA family transcriptional regulator [Thalassolituus pacificus]|uniref:Helix-turn-helix domain-containing protein n=1 Tax=Thalassolituus pacificus TaxID=2975440 RepID=A0A9X2WG94_9GAMM|nr:helix-turn-helix domain-containing protein [Thalassolituus pacificus]MCT7359530.1 helix-turn-helix domain-containing protein [Thalassolituus pacificus]